ncbi:MAG: phosphatidate cytidylyltransferase, partial [Pseudomonadota bacterium]
LCGALAARITGGPLEVWLLVGGLISFFAQLGDFAESVIKRQYGVKDTSGFVPGHGGVMDRVDGLGIVCVVAVLVFLIEPGVPSLLGLSV